MDINTILQKTFFNEKESAVYLACLQLGKSTATKIAKKAGIKRPTTYLILDKLNQRGVVSIQQTTTTTYFIPTHPNKLLTILKDKERLVNELLPSLLALYKNQTQKLNVEMFEGEDGMYQIYLEIIEFLKKGKEVFFYGYPSSMYFYDSLINLWLKESRNKRYHIRELLSYNNDMVIDYVKKQKMDNKNPNHAIKILPKKHGLIKNDNAIFGDKLVIFSTTEQPFALIITSKTIVNSYRAIFNASWSISKSI